jgi:hypothetical protein
MVTASIIAGGAGLLGSAMAGRSAEKAANASAQAQLQAAKIAAEEQRFRPVGISTRFGTSRFGFGPEGRLETAGYSASPEIQALQARLADLYGTSLGQAERAPAISEGLFGLGQQYLAQTPEQARSKYLQEQYAMLDPIRQREEERLASTVFGRGRAGLNIGTQGQPELAALANARRTQDLQLAAQAEQAAQQRIGFGAGLFGTGIGLQTQSLAPFQQQFGVSQLLEQAALQPLDIGAQLGGRAATAGANVGQSLLTGGLGAAQTQLQGSLVGPSAMAQNIANTGQQYLRGQQQQQLFNQLYGPSSPSGLQSYYGFNPFNNTNPYAMASQAGQLGTS